jgi:hypothetical protein
MVGTSSSGLFAAFVSSSEAEREREVFPTGEEGDWDEGEAYLGERSEREDQSVSKDGEQQPGECSLLALPSVHSKFGTATNGSL